MGVSQPPSGDASTFRPQISDPRSVYIHIPFCRHRCGYCNFTLVAGRDHLIDRFLTALEKEISWLERSYELDTLFLGGGTPSHLSEKQLSRLQQILKTRFTWSASTEVSAECNPNDLTPERGDALAKLGVNRISLGVQSFNSEKLQRLERDHLRTDVEQAVQVARLFASSVSIDLIFAAPDEQLVDWERDLQDLDSVLPDHVSTYELTYEKGTRFWNRLNRGQLRTAEEELRAEMYELAIQYMSAKGWTHYEISSYSAPDHECRHNLAYWKGDPYFAFGPGAARFVDGIRETNHQSTTTYMRLVESNQLPVSDREHLDSNNAARERLAIGLRMLGGVVTTEFQQRTGYSIHEILGSLMDTLVENGVLETFGERCRLTHQGVMVYDWIAAEIISGR